MTGFILGQKNKQTQAYNTAGIRIPVTYIKTSPCYLIAIQKPETQRYFAIKLGFGLANQIKKSTFGEVKKAGIMTPLNFYKEFRLEKHPTIKAIEENGKSGISVGDKKMLIGDLIDASIFFKPGDKVQVSAIAKGKGFQGVVTRHHFKGGPHTHGQSDRERAPGSIGQTTTPGRVYKGKRMAGRMGGQRVTIKNLVIHEVTKESIAIAGLIPGSKKANVEIISKT
ncbi:50S ribosomal protein L3 [Candidatus Roizmanbacteria bacterium CG2_30_33_16]|uniref:50S ribosomal protein L3 n=5 Tax=Candidatus Roizmaniibacteriota TaxID=1752723 RepID=A0A2M7E5M2_9BACT|nr:50S ribosomal protein L3 [Candidatus Roizmanbacteria bacterium]OIP83332.1 MAG: 50S ribosomal protein L3 [Candidatus Roizmanbacteria bacterium CG2_30_33_16]PIP64566.1 MAG: 50S ribosomal protein L3 [Candidatus Roizmanbacteria bacterium CG22_combo_CG10-13_8_21_14_all_33_16]PIV63024.1 MAG: 50S ribosomal protein L3 [Candidatus Roizmanbacteria bacterium CG01_land_8_20_14_3_00_33_9]PIX72305.1 MAG: 50S ribosomal protein L3 [Candidatus Roizmanbacteria bacterium CG_4_10_14_3_um_filter_33_21]PJB88647.